ncbi:MAG: protein kinase [Candidatus Sulfotelmatobacter sp.]|jgi:serine/threonine protein kinase
MDSERWEKIQTIFHQAVELPESERSSFLEAACGDDDSLAEEVKAMLRTDSQDSSLLDRGLHEVADRVFGSPTTAITQQEFGAYRLLRVLGEGGMGVVWLAQRQDAGNLVAIKFLPHAGLSPARRERFTHEIRTLGKLNHPFIARLYDAGTLSDGTPWFVMEYVEGIRFVDYCRQKPLSIEDRLRLFRSVCEAVQYAHGQEIIHRDLKPSNILVDESGAPRLLDFGIARELHSLQSPSEQTQPGLRFMSPDYAAPEWIRDGDVGFYTDVYSLGVVLYEILAGRLPFEQSQQGVTANPSADPVAPSVAFSCGPQADSSGQISRASWADLDVLCLKAIHKDAQQRYSSVEALIRDIDHYLIGEPLEARPDGVRYRADKFVRRNLRPLAAASAALILWIGLVTFYTFRLARERNRASREAAITASMNRFLTDDLLGRSNPFKSGDAKQPFVDAVSQASQRIDSQFEAEPVVAARLHRTIARAFEDRSDFPGARQEYGRARDLFVQGEGPASQSAILVRLNLAAMEAKSGEPGSLALAQSTLKDTESAIARIASPDRELAVWLPYTRGVIAIQSNNGQAANKNLTEAFRQAQMIPSFDQAALWKIQQVLAFSYIRLGDGAKAEALYRNLIDTFKKIDGPDSARALLMGSYLSETLMMQRKYAEEIQLANLIYPSLVKELGEDHQASMEILATRAASEGSLHMWEAAIRDDLTSYALAARKQGSGSILALGPLSDAGLSQCRSGRYAEGEANARNAWTASEKGFGPRAGITGGCGYSLAICLMGLNRFEEASRLLENIDIDAVTQLSGDATVGPSIALAKGQIAARREDFASAHLYAQQAEAALDRPDADSIDRQALHDLRKVIEKNLRASR